MNVLVVGAGQIGAFYDFPGETSILTHAHAFSASPNFNLLGFTDLNTNKAAEAAKRWGVKVYESMDAAFNASAIDVVVVATPDNTHGNVLYQLADMPVRLVFAEKPLASNVDEAERMVSLYREKGVPLAVNYTRRYVSQIQAVRQAIHAGEYGRFIGGSGSYGKGLYHNGSHLLDLIRFLTGNYSVVKAYECIQDYQGDDDSLSAVLRGVDGPLFYLKAIDCRLYTVMEIDLMFERGRVRLTGCARRLEIYNISPDPLFSGYQGLRLLSSEMTDYPQALATAARNIYEHLSGNASLVCSGEEALETLRLCQALRTLSL